MKNFVLLICLALFLPEALQAMTAPKPDTYGRVIINNYSRNAGLASVVFDHWLHRSRFTCRLCHVDIGFAMEAGATGIKASENIRGNYCGACHNGSRVFGDKKIFASCSDKFTQEESGRCNRCHSLDKDVKKEYDFVKFTEKFPRQSYGSFIDWEKAEADRIIKPVDVLNGVSVKRKPLPVPKDFAIESKGAWMSDIKFSHKKHAVWNGCELCHPDIFEIKKGATKYSMLQIYNGEYCGACHDKVAFPLFDCGRCHTKPVK